MCASQIVFQRNFPSKCLKDAPKEEVSINSKWLIRGGFVNRLMGGVYSYLPLGVRVLHKIENIVREEMNAVGSSEILMPALHPQHIWEVTGRWEKMADIIYKVKDGEDKVYGLGPSHEEVVTPLMGTVIQSYKDLPLSVYQIQTKFRNEPRPKSGLLRGREFRMKDMYSFHTSQEDLDIYYDRVIQAYHNVFNRCGFGDRTHLTFASGGAFSKYSHEFQAVTPYGEDTVFLDRKKNIAVNKEVIDDAATELGIDMGALETVKAIEVGNIFRLGTRYTDACGVSMTGADGRKGPVYMGCYGIGTSRIFGTTVEMCHDENGIVWPASIAPFDLHIVSLGKDAAIHETAKKLAQGLATTGKEILVDDRDCSPGQKFSESDIIGIPYRIVCSPKLQEKSMVEIKDRKTGKVTECAQDNLTQTLSSLCSAG